MWKKIWFEQVVWKKIWFEKVIWKNLKNNPSQNTKNERTSLAKTQIHIFTVNNDGNVNFNLMFFRMSHQFQDHFQKP